MAGATLKVEVPGRSYRVGGAVRDALMGLSPGDTDWVVVGTTPQAMLDAGFRPVGRDFPVFLHPVTGDEYALARTERKAGRGYRGFVVQADPAVTLEDDLARRDLTINAMAMDEREQLIDPYGGARDVADGVLRHVSNAFVEDPVRLLRLARFAARWPRFSVASETQELLKQIVSRGEADALVPERVWQELARGLMEVRPSRMLEVLNHCGATERLLPGLQADARRMQVLDHSAAAGAPLSVRAACLLHGAAEMAERWRAPVDVRDLAQALQREFPGLAEHLASAESAMALLERCDAWRRPERLTEMLWAAQCLALAPEPWALRERGIQVLAAARDMDAAARGREAATLGLSGPAMGAFIRQGRLEAVAKGLAHSQSR